MALKLPTPANLPRVNIGSKTTLPPPPPPPANTSIPKEISDGISLLIKNNLAALVDLTKMKQFVAAYDAVNADPADTSDANKEKITIFRALCIAFVQQSTLDNTKKQVFIKAITDINIKVFKDLIVNAVNTLRTAIANKEKAIADAEKAARDAANLAAQRALDEKRAKEEAARIAAAQAAAALEAARAKEEAERIAAAALETAAGAQTGTKDKGSSTSKDFDNIRDNTLGNNTGGRVDIGNAKNDLARAKIDEQIQREAGNKKGVDEAAQAQLDAQRRLEEERRRREAEEERRKRDAQNNTDILSDLTENLPDFLPEVDLGGRESRIDKTIDKIYKDAQAANANIKGPLDLANFLTQQEEEKTRLPRWNITFEEKLDSTGAESTKIVVLADGSIAGNYNSIVRFGTNMNTSYRKFLINEKTREAIAKESQGQVYPIKTRVNTFHQFLNKKIYSKISEQDRDAFFLEFKTELQQKQQKFVQIIADSVGKNIADTRLFKDTSIGQERKLKLLELFNFVRDPTEYEKIIGFDPHIMDFQTLYNKFKEIYDREPEVEPTPEELRGEVPRRTRLTNAGYKIMVDLFVRIIVVDFCLKTIPVLDSFLYTKEFADVDPIVEFIVRQVRTEIQRIGIEEIFTREIIKGKNEQDKLEYLGGEFGIAARLNEDLEYARSAGFKEIETSLGDFATTAEILARLAQQESTWTGTSDQIGQEGGIQLKDYSKVTISNDQVEGYEFDLRFGETEELKRKVEEIRANRLAAKNYDYRVGWKFWNRPLSTTRSDVATSYTYTTDVDLVPDPNGVPGASMPPPTDSASSQLYRLRKKSVHDALIELGFDLAESRKQGKLVKKI